MAPAGKERRRPLVVIGLGAALALGVGWLLARSPGESASPPAASPGGVSPTAGGAPGGAGAPGPSLGAVPAGAGALASPASPASGDAQAARALWQQRLARAQETLQSYLQSTRYPPDSSPAREHPDQLTPRAPVTRRLPLTKNAERPSQDVQLALRQDRLYLVGAESARLGVRCEDSLGKALPCAVTGRAHALQGAAAQAVPPSAVEFTDDGRNGDEAPGDGWLTATLQPVQQGFRGALGSLRVDLDVRSGSETGFAFFDLIYTPDPPARLTGTFREALEDGSVSLYAGIEVRTPGRYVLSARVDDARGHQLALLGWNEPLPAGPREVKFVLFGKLLLDEQPAWPLTVRDVDGFLLREDQDPDRLHVAPLGGAVHTTQRYPSSALSAAEWQSEQRSRYRDRLEQDVKEAQAELDKHGGPP